MTLPTLRTLMPMKPMTQMQQFASILDGAGSDIRRAAMKRNYSKCAQAMNDIFFRCDRVQITRLNAEDRASLSDFFEAFLTEFVAGWFQLTPEDMTRFVGLNPLIANLLVASRYKTADMWLDQLLLPDGGIRAPFDTNLPKVLTLLSPRLHRQFDFDQLGWADPKLVAEWWAIYPRCVANTISLVATRNLQRYFQLDPPKRFPQTRCLIDTSFLLPYKDVDGRSMPLKSAINQSVRRRWPQLRVTNKPDPKKIAIISARWLPMDAVHRSMSPLMDILKDHFQVDLIHLVDVLGQNPGPGNADQNGFENVHTVHMDGMKLRGTGPLLDNEYSAVIYPDVGLNALSTILSNQRIAPIQITTVGHPVSTMGSEIDFFISGEFTETKDNPAKNYSERLILIPGLGSQTKKPDYVCKNPTRQDGPVVINACWAPMKFNQQLLKTVRDAMTEAKNEARIHFFTGNTVLRHAGFNALDGPLKAMFDGKAILMSDAGGYESYMTRLEAGDFGIDSFPFGGYNTIIDSLHIGKPVVTLEGEQWANRVSSAVNKLVGLEAMVATDYTAYKNLIVRMIDDQSFRQTMQAAIWDRILQSEIYENTQAPLDFLAAVEFLIEHQPDNSLCQHAMYICHD